MNFESTGVWTTKIENELCIGSFHINRSYLFINAKCVPESVLGVKALTESMLVLSNQKTRYKYVKI